MTEEKGLPFEGLAPEERESIEIVVSDVDDTITKNGKLYPNALHSLWKLKRMGKMIVLLIQ